jgi:adenylate kinase family enzyme
MFLFLASTLFVFGPSCGGKSTLFKALIKQLGPTWTYLDRDLLIENGLRIHEKADEMIEECIVSFQSKDQNDVVDAQIPCRAQNKDELYVLVYAPLGELFARDSRRTIRLNRSSERAHYARLYVDLASNLGPS